MLSKLLHPYRYQFLHYLLSNDNGYVLNNNRMDRIFVLLSADYGNIGDIAITIAQDEFLRTCFPDREIVHIPSSSSYQSLKSLVYNIGKNDIITFVGGGNSGDIYYPYEIYRQLVVSLIKHNPIINFPQSVKFLNSDNIFKAKRIYCQHDRFLYLARDKESYNFFKDIYNVKSILLPDIVMTLDKYQDCEREGCAICLRSDKEALLTVGEKKKIINTLDLTGIDFELIDTYKPIDKLSFQNAKSLFEDTISLISRKKLLITDRLHGMIFGFITGTPTIVLPNNNNKILNCYQWLKDCSYIHFFTDLSDLGISIQDVLKSNRSRDEFIRIHTQLIKTYDKLKSVILDV